MSRTAFLLITLSFFLWSNDAYAWGPAVHVNLALKILGNLTLLAPVLRHLLKKHPNDFIYGNLSADITLGKKFIDYYYHCHNWRVGIEILEHARDDSHKAFAYGYLCHLAADVIAHNFFIPDKIVRNHQTLTARHMYWELRYDLRMDPQHLEKAHIIAKHYHENNDPLLENILKETLFSFKTNKKIFNNLIKIQKQGHVQKFMQMIANRSPLPLEDERAIMYYDLAYEGVVHILNQLENAKVFKADPAGLRKLEIASDLRKKIRKLQSNGVLKKGETEKIIMTFHEFLRDTLLQPEQCPTAEELITSIY